MESKQTCPGTDQPVRYEHASVIPYCSVCGKDLSSAGKRQRAVGRTVDGRYNVYAGRHYSESNYADTMGGMVWDSAFGMYVND